MRKRTIHYKTMNVSTCHMSSVRTMLILQETVLNGVYIIEALLLYYDCYYN